MANAAVFLDRDGTLIEDTGYAARPEQIRIFGGVGRALADLAQAGYKLIVVTNQSSLARGLATEEDLERFHQALDEQLEILGVRFDAYYVCPHHPDVPDSPRPDLVVECECRKPKPGLILRAAEDFDINLSASWTVGDTWRDIAAGHAAGVKTIKLPADLDHDFARPPDVAPPTAEADDLVGAARIILGITDAEANGADTEPETGIEPALEPSDDLFQETAAEGGPQPENADAWVQIDDDGIAPNDVEEAQETETPEDLEPVDTAEQPPPELAPGQAEAEAILEQPATESPDVPPSPAAPDRCERCGRDLSEADLADGRAAERDGFLLCAECLSLQPRESADTPPGDETDLLRSILVELRRLNRAQRTPGVTWLRLLAYVVQAVALFCGLVLGLVGDDKTLYFQIAVFLQLVVIALVLFERKP